MKSNKNERKTGLVRVREGFSDRSGISPRNKTMQFDDFDDDTRIKISNRLFEILEGVFDSPRDFYDTIHPEELANSFCKSLINDVFCQRNVLRKGYIFIWREVFESINEVIEQASYNEVLDIVEFTCRWLDSNIDNKKGTAFGLLNELFEQEFVGYRFVNGRILAVSDEVEINEIEEACDNPVYGCKAHIQKAVDFLADRKHKDYKNSIKESICAVESMCRVIIRNDCATLGDALKHLEKGGMEIHPCLKQAFLKLYGYTSDTGGIRHAEGMAESLVSFEDAKFILVCCSAFVNYLLAKTRDGVS